MSSYELIGSKSSPLCHMSDYDRLLASDSNEDSNDDHSSADHHKYHTLDHLDSYDTVLDLENNLMNNSLMNESHHHNHMNSGQHLSQHNISLNTHLINNNNCLNSNISNNNSNNSSNNKRKAIEGNGMTNGGPQSVVANGVPANGPKRVPPPNGKKTKGRVKIKMEFIDNKLRRYTTFSKRKTGIMKKAYELSTLTGTQVMLLVASETGHVYTFATRKLQPMITSDAGKALIQTCLNSPDPNGLHCGDQRMSATGFEETDLSYAVGDDSPNDKSDESCEPSGHCLSSGESSDNGADDSPELLTGVLNTGAAVSTGPTTYAQLENALPLNYLNDINLINNKITNRQLISQLTNSNVLSNQTSLSHTSQSTMPSLSSLVTTTSSLQLTPNTGTISSASKLGTIGSNPKANQTIHMSHTSAQQLLSAGNILLCANGNQITLPTAQSSQSSSNNGPTLMYNPTQGLVYATAGAANNAGNASLITDGLILNLGQNHSTGNTEVLINNNTFSQLHLQQTKPMTSSVNQTSGAKRGDGVKKQRMK